MAYHWFFSVQEDVIPFLKIFCFPKTKFCLLAYPDKLKTKKQGDWELSNHLSYF